MMSMGERFLLAATVTNVQDRQYMYEACKICYTKLLNTVKSLICKKCNCDYTAESAYYRYCVHLTAADSSCLANITVFGSVLDTFFGAGCSEFYFNHVLKLKNKYGNFVDTIIKVAIEKTFIGQNLIFGFKVPKSFCCIKGKNCEISLKDITRIAPYKNNPNVLPELIAVQLLPQTNSHLSHTVIQTLNILEKSIQEMGYLKLSEKGCDFIQALESQNRALYDLPSHFDHQNSSNCSFDTTRDFNQTSLGLSCDTSLASKDDFQSPRILQPLVSGDPSIVTHTAPEKIEVNPLTFELQGGKVSQTNEMQRDKKKEDICAVNRSERQNGVSPCVNSTIERTCNKSQAQKCKSLNLKYAENKRVEEKHEPVNNENCKTRKADSASFNTSRLSWSVVKYNREKSSQLKRLRLGKVANSGKDSVVCTPTNSLKKKDIKCLSAAYEGCSRQLHVNQEKVSNQTLEWEEETLKDDGDVSHAKCQDSEAHAQKYIKDNTLGVDQMPDSEDLELFLAAANADSSAYLESSKSPAERKTKLADSENTLCVSQNVAEHYQAQNIAIHDRSGEKTLLHNESLSITDDYARSISFNVTLRRSKKMQKCGFQSSPPCSNTNSSLNTDFPESENLWQFLDGFSVENVENHITSNFQRNNICNSLNLSKKHNVSTAATEEALNSTSYCEGKNSEDLFTSPGTRDRQLAGDKNCTSTALSHTSSFQSNLSSEEKDAAVCKASNAELLTSYRMSESGGKLVSPSSSHSLDDTSFKTLNTKVTSEFLNSCEGMLTHIGITDKKEVKSEYLSANAPFSSNENYFNTSNDSLLSNSLDLFNSPQCSTVHLGKNLSSDKSWQVMKILEMNTPLVPSQNNFIVSQNKLQMEQKLLSKRPPTVTSDKAPFKKVRFTSQRKEHYFQDFDCIQTQAKPLGQKTLKSCLKLQKGTHCYDRSPHISRESSKGVVKEVNSEDLFSEEEEYSRRVSTASYNNSVDLFSQSPVPNVVCVSSKYLSSSSPLNQAAMLLSDVRNELRSTGNESSLELFSQSEITSTPICSSHHQPLSRQNCMTPDLFD